MAEENKKEENKIAQINEACKILKINEEKLTEEQKKGKYKKALYKQRQKVVDLMCDIANCYLPGFYAFNNQKDTDRFCTEYNQYLEANLPKIKSIIGKILQYYDYEKVLEELTPLSEHVFQNIYMPIFQEHNVSINGKVWNDIIKMIWNPKTNTWMRKEEDGSITFRMFPAPQ